MKGRRTNSCEERDRNKGNGGVGEKGERKRAALTLYPYISMYVCVYIHIYIYIRTYICVSVHV